MNARKARLKVVFFDQIEQIVLPSKDFPCFAGCSTSALAIATAVG
jgi:hypothetical protein